MLRFYSPGTCGLLRACSSHGGGRHEGVSRNMSRLRTGTLPASPTFHWPEKVIQLRPPVGCGNTLHLKWEELMCHKGKCMDSGRKEGWGYQ